MLIIILIFQVLILTIGSFLLRKMLKNFKKEKKEKEDKKKWREINKHNDTYLIKGKNMEKIKVGRHTYGPIEVYEWGAEEERIEIGSFVSIANDVKFILGGNHKVKGISTFPLKHLYFGEFEAESKGPIQIEDNVWIGMDTIILSGVKIGKGSIIGAGSVVTKTFPPYSVIGGNPARLLKERFSENKLEKIEKIDFVNLTDEEIRGNINKYYEEI